MQVGSIFNTSEAAMSGRIDKMAEIAHKISTFNTIEEDAAQEKTDLIEEFTDMKMNQRAFEADAKVIQTADDMLEEMLGLL